MVNLDSDVVRAHPEWITGPNSRFLAEVGLPMPILNPEHALLLKVTTAGD
jgi:alpha-galactosidase